MDFAVPAGHIVKLKKCEKKDKYQYLASELRKLWEHDVDINCNRRSWYSHQRIVRGAGGLGNERTSGVYPNHSFIQISQNTENSHWHLRRLAVIHSPLGNHRLNLAWKSHKWFMMIINIIINIIIIVVMIILWKILSAALAAGLSLEFERQKVSSSLHDYSFRSL